MKKVFLVAVMAVMFMCAKAQEPLSFEKVITVDSVSKDVIFSKISEWIASAFIGTDGDYYANRQDGVITKDYQFQYVYGSFVYKAYDGNVRCKIKVMVKDGKLKVTLFNFIHKAIAHSNQLEDFSMGLLTNEDISGKKGLNKSAHDKVWKRMKTFCQNMAEKNFVELEKIKFKEKSDNW